MDDRVRAEIIPDPAIEGHEGMGRCEAAIEQQPHRVAFVTVGRLDADKHVAELCAGDQYILAVRLELARCRAPFLLDLGQIRLGRDNAIGRHEGVHIGFLAILHGVAFDHPAAHLIRILRHFHVIAFGLKPNERAVQRIEHRKELRRAGRAAVGWEVEQHDGELAVLVGRTAQLHQLQHLVGHRLGAFRAGLHGAHAV